MAENDASGRNLLFWPCTANKGVFYFTWPFQTSYLKQPDHFIIFSCEVSDVVLAVTCFSAPTIG